ncbi:MAG: hypothetical protein V1859_07535 [archaeon]
MAKIMMIYSIPDGKDAIRITFNRKLFNYNLQSHEGKYKKKSQGILSKYEKPLRSVVIFDKDKLAAVEVLCSQLSIDAKFYLIKEI